VPLVPKKPKNRAKSFELIAPPIEKKDAFGTGGSTPNGYTTQTIYISNKNYIFA
jgi:hypothetical protein